MFIGRIRELETLDKLYKSDKFEFAVVYGRRRIGKTALINQFTGGKKAIYFTGVESTEKQNLENFSKSIMDFSSGIETEFSFFSFQSALEYVFKLAEKERLILVIDEYPYVARSSKGIASSLQLLIDKYKDSSKLMLLLCGSLSYMEENVLAHNMPLYDRKTAQIKLMPFDFEEVCQYFKNFSDEDKALIYGIAGGTPHYLLQMNDNLSIEENIKNTYLNSASFLYEEPANLLKQEVREPAVYTAIISAIAGGASRMSEISNNVGEDTNVCSIYIKNLINLDIVKKETPYGDKSPRKSVYSIEDNMFRFWYRFVPINNSLIARGAADLVYRRISPLFSEYMGKVFEEICKQYLWKQLFSGNCPVEFASLGSWWSSNSKGKNQDRIAIMGEQDTNTALFAECEWSSEKTGSAALESLVSRSSLFPHKQKYYFLFSKSGFTKDCMNKAQELGVVNLVELAQLTKAVYVNNRNDYAVPVWLI